MLITVHNAVNSYKKRFFYDILTCMYGHLTEVLMMNNTENEAYVRVCAAVCVFAKKKAVIAIEYKAARFLQMGKKSFHFF